MSSGEPARLYRSRQERIVGGVAGGFAVYLGVDPVLVRLSFVALAFAGVGVLLYLVAWIAVPEAPVGYQPATDAEGRRGSEAARLVVGTVLVGVGVLLLLDWLTPIGRFFWPAALIATGGLIVTYGIRR
jgi:phage shock protein C